MRLWLFLGDGHAGAGGEVTQGLCGRAVAVELTFDAAVDHGVTPGEGGAAIGVGGASGTSMRDAERTDRGTAAGGTVVVALNAGPVVAAWGRGGAGGRARRGAMVGLADGVAGAVARGRALDAAVEGQVAAEQSGRGAVRVARAGDAGTGAAVQRGQDAIHVLRADRQIIEADIRMASQDRHHRRQGEETGAPRAARAREAHGADRATSFSASGRAKPDGKRAR